MMEGVETELKQLHKELSEAMDLEVNNQAWARQMQVDEEIARVEKAAAQVGKAEAAEAKALVAAAKSTTRTKASKRQWI